MKTILEILEVHNLRNQFLKFVAYIGNHPVYNMTWMNWIPKTHALLCRNTPSTVPNLLQILLNEIKCSSHKWSYWLVICQKVGIIWWNQMEFHSLIYIIFEERPNWRPEFIHLIRFTNFLLLEAFKASIWGIWINNNYLLPKLQILFNSLINAKL